MTKRKSKFSSENKAKLNLAFKALRKLGYIAKQSFMCCSSCAGAQMGHDVQKDDS